MKDRFYVKLLAAALLLCLLALCGCGKGDSAGTEPQTEPTETEALSSTERTAPAEETAVSTETEISSTETETAPEQTEETSAQTDQPSTEAETVSTEPTPPETYPAPREPETAPPETETAPPQTEPPGTTAPPAHAGNPGDTEPPFFLHFTKTVTLERGSAFNVHRYVSYIDDLDSDVELTVDGAPDTGTVGEYRLKLTLTDDSGNVTASDMTVRIVEPTPSGTPDGSYTYTPPPPRSFADFAASYKTDGTMVGIDVSKWQGEIDFDRVAAAGCEFVIIRIGGYAGGVFEDPNYAENIKRAKAAGLKVGVYWYSEEDGPAKVRENAAFLYSLLGGQTLDFPVFFDWEDYFNLEDYRMSVKDLNDMFLAFRAEAEARGYRAALYNSAYYLGVLWGDEVKGRGVWLAHYTDRTNYGGRYFLWQQGFGRIDGIDGDVDVDVFYPAEMNGF